MADFDANATTAVSEAAMKAMCEWVNKGNPSAVNEGAAACRKLLQEYRETVALVAQVVCANTAGRDNPRAYHMVITSGASEANAMVMRATTEAYRFRRKTRPHLIVGAAEHKGVMLCAEHLEKTGQADVDWLPVDELGRYNAADVARLRRSNTALLVAMAANNETGAVNDIAALGLAAAEHKIPYYCDAVQAFGKIPFFPLECGVSAFAVSAHKCHGPKGVGIVGIRRDFAEGYDLAAMIPGSQNEGLRGGTENVAGVAGAIVGLHETVKNLVRKTDRIRRYRRLIVNTLAKSRPVLSFSAWRQERAAGTKVLGRRFVILTPGVAPGSGTAGADALALPNTLLLAVVDGRAGVCNARMRDRLLKEGFAVSIGSACATGDPRASHVIRAMGADDEIARGTLRISLPQSARQEDCIALAKKLVTMAT
jgi:cysteine desulfurase